MPSIIACSSCGRQLRIPDDLGGELVKCPTCGHTFTAPRDAGPRPLSARPETDTYGLLPLSSSEERPRRPLDQERERPSKFEMRHHERPAVTPHRGAMILVFGILGIVMCGGFGPVAWILGQNDLVEIRGGRMDPAGERLTEAGRICGIIGTVLCLVEILCCCMGLLGLLTPLAGGLG